MLGKKQKNTTSYELEAYPGYWVDAVDKEEYVEFWLYHENYGIKSEMFGLPKHQSSYAQMLLVVENNLPEHIMGYQEDYVDMDDWIDFYDCDEECEYEESDIRNARMEDFGLNADCNFFIAPMCQCGCGHKAQLCMESPDQIRNVITAMLLENECQSCAVFFRDLSGAMKMAMKKENKIMACDIKPELTNRLDLFVVKFDLHQYALLLEENPGAWHAVEE